MVPGVIEPELFGMDKTTLSQMQAEEYCAKILGATCQAALSYYNNGRALLINYQQLPEAALTSILDFFQFSHTEADLDHMRRVAQFDAKNPAAHFGNDTATKTREASDLLRQMADKWVVPFYERLEAMRRIQEAAS